MIMNKMNEMMDMINIHLSTVETQNDIKAEIIECAKQQLIALFDEFKSQIVTVEFGSEEQMHQSKFNILIYDLTK